MGGQVRNKRRFKMKKSHKKGIKVNDTRSFRKKSNVSSWRSIKDIPNKLDLADL